MASVASQLIEEITTHAQRDSLEDAQTVLTFRITYVYVCIDVKCCCLIHALVCPYYTNHILWSEFFLCFAVVKSIRIVVSLCGCKI